jgi:phytanoyl-CoA hydroxylase
LTEEEMQSIRSKAASVLTELQEQVQQSCSTPSTTHNSWVRGHVGLPDHEISYQCRFLDQQGFLLVKTFANKEEIDSLKQQMARLAEDWDPAQKTIAFRTDEESNKAQGSDDYFLESADKVHFFAELDALHKEHGSLKDQYQNHKLDALNKAGHGMHMIPGAFHTYTTSPKVKNVVQELGWTDPVVPQSMYIFKQANIGGAVNSHQDSTFLYTEPKQTCLGLWLALDDATLQNGCLWVRPKSHWEPVRRHFQRNPLYFGTDALEQGSNIAHGDLTEPKMLMETLVDNDENVPWEGLLPEGSEPPCQGLLEAGFIPIECKAGDLLCFPGELDHLSLPNCSDAQRHTFQLHLVQGETAGITWSKKNWLQYPQGTPFLSIKKS